MVGRRAVRGDRVYPTDDVAVRIGLECFEDDLIAARWERTDDDLESSELSGLDGICGAVRGPGDFGDDVGDGAVVGLYWRREMRGFDVVGPARHRLRQSVQERWRSRDRDVEFRCACWGLFVRDPEGDLDIARALGSTIGGDGDV